MTPEVRWQEIDRELADLWQGRVVPGDPVEREAELLAEQDRLEWDAGESGAPV
jgi:hypothetical protein